MNEELRIIIRASVDEAIRSMNQVQDELEDVADAAEKADEEVSQAFTNMKKAGAIAVAAMAAVSAAMVSLGKTARETVKGFDKLNTTFLNAGSTTAQASKTYKELFSFLGEHDKAIETAQSLALITSNEEELAQWTNILQGAFAEMGDKLPIEGLAEAANETINVGKVTGVFADALNWAGVSEDAFNATLAQTTSLAEREAIIRSTLNGLYGNSAAIYEATNQATKKYNESQANLNIALAQSASYTTPLLISINNLGTTFLTELAPALATVATYLTAFIQLLIEATRWIGSLFGSTSSGAEGATADIEGYKNAMSGYLSSLNSGFGATGGALDDTLDGINAVKKATMGFDELNIVSSPTAPAPAVPSGAAGSIPTLPTAPNPADFGIGGGIDLSGFTDGVEEAKGKIESVLTLVGLAAVGIGAWKLTNFIQDLLKADDLAGLLKGKLQSVGGALAIAGGAMLLVAGYSDAWVNGLDWENFALILGGIGLIVGGLVLSFGPLAGAIGLIVGGIAALVIGIKDLVENGYSMEGVLMVLFGAVTVLVGVIWAFNAALLANPITWIVVAIAALVAAFVILWNECDGFRQFWIDLWNIIKEAFHAVVEWIKKAFTAVVNFFKDNWQALLLLLVNPFAGAFKLLYDNCDGFREFIDKWVKKIADFFKNMVSNIKNAFSGIGEWFSNLFSKVGGKIGDSVSGAIKSAINWVLDKAIGIINGFLKAINIAIGVINAIPGVNIKKLEMLEVPKLAKGGITTGATAAIIGEAGREAVLPLENNTEWMNELADRIAARNGAPSRIVLMLDGKELGWASINSINNITKQTGSLQLVTV